MKKGKLVALLAVVIVVIVTGFVKFMKQKKIDMNNDSQNSYSEEDSGNAEDGISEKSVKDDEGSSDSIEDQNVYSISDGYILYNKMGYRINTFRVFDSLEEFESYEGYNPEYLEFAPAQTEGTQIVYVDYEITNEGTSDVEYHPISNGVYYINGEGLSYDKDKGFGEFGALYGENSEMFYSSLVENPVDEKNPDSPILKPGDMVKLQSAYCCGGHDGEGDNSKELKPTELFEGKWYFESYQNQNSSHTDEVSLDDKSRIFFLLEE